MLRPPDLQHSSVTADLCLKHQIIAGLMLSLGAEGALGFVVSHELVHGHHKMDQWLANIMLCTTGYMHWSVSHIAHHTQASACTHTYSQGLPSCFEGQLLSFNITAHAAGLCPETALGKIDQNLQLVCFSCVASLCRFVPGFACEYISASAC